MVDICKTESLENRRISLWNQLCFMTLSQIQKIRVNKIVIKKADFEKLLNKTYAAGYQDGLKEPRPAQVWMTSKRGFDTEPKVLSI